jgi:proteasome accessory factor B
MAAKRSERLIDLLLLLLHARLPLPWSEIRRLPAYSPAGRDVASVQRQFERDKEDLRALGVPIEYVEPIEEETEGGYVLDRRRYFLPRLTFTENEAFALALAEGIAGRMAQALGEDAFAAWTKLACLPGLPTALHGDEAKHIHLAPAPAPSAEERAVVETLREAIDENRRVRMRYRTMGTGQAKERLIDPYGLLIRRGVPYVIGYDHSRRAVLMFRISRIEKLEPAPRSGGGPDFEVPARFSVSTYAQRAPWEFGSEPPIRISVHVAPRIAWLVERSLGRRATVAREKDGATRVDLSASDPGVAIRWVLALGRGAEIVGPPEVRRMARDLLLRVSAMHEGEKSAVREHGTGRRRAAARTEG